MFRDRITQGIGWLFTINDFKRIASRYGADFDQCHAVGSQWWMTYDVIGDRPGLREAMESHRLVGIRFRYFKTHYERLAELQSRIDKAKRSCGYGNR